jgi:UDP-GlcNAc:undecaprenyl-phosphate/decaprenyl-phosphate GlcNAc-1-phosphate transferase
MKTRKEREAIQHQSLPIEYRESRLLQAVIFLRRIAVPISLVGLAALIVPFFMGIETTGIKKQMQIFGLALFGSALITPAMEWFSHRIGALDHPDPRKKHAAATPILGGVAVFIAYFGAKAAHLEFTRQMMGILLGGLLILLVGVIDDVRRGGVPAKIRMLAHIAAAVVAIYFNVCLSLYPHSLCGQVLSIVLTIVWIVGIINAINFLDGMDGLAAGLAAISSGAFFIIAYRLNNPYLGFVSVALCGATIGFLVHNFKPARIFLGDSGATFIGYTLACLGVMGAWSKGNPFVSFSVPIMVLGVPIFDMIYTTVERFASGKVRTVSHWLAYTGRDHFHHRLSDIGFPDHQAVLFLYFLNLILALGAAVIATSFSNVNVALMLLQAACSLLVVVILMRFGGRSGGNHSNGASSGANNPENSN